MIDVFSLKIDIRLHRFDRCSQYKERLIDVWLYRFHDLIDVFRIKIDTTTKKTQRATYIGDTYSPCKPSFPLCSHPTPDAPKLTAPTALLIADIGQSVTLQVSVDAVPGISSILWQTSDIDSGSSVRTDLSVGGRVR